MYLSPNSGSWRIMSTISVRKSETSRVVFLGSSSSGSRRDRYIITSACFQVRNSANDGVDVTPGPCRSVAVITLLLVEGLLHARDPVEGLEGARDLRVGVH